MYKIPHFTETGEASVHAFMYAYPFVTITGNNDGRSVATQVPALLHERDGKIILRAHIMRKTDHHLAFENNPEVLVLFTGPHCYVSSGWYTPEEKGGATWNYQTVHARGTVKFLDEAATINILAELTEKYEKDQQQPLLLNDMPPGYVDTYVKAIAGFEIELHDIHAIFKLSQNRTDESYKNIVMELMDSDDTDAHKVAVEMIKRRPQLF